MTSNIASWYEASKHIAQIVVLYSAGRVFDLLHAICLEPQPYVHIVDEVESLAAARQAAISGSEPSDSIRVSFSSFCFVSIGVWFLG